MKPAVSDETRFKWPLQLHQHSAGWSITYYGPDGHARHVAHGDTDIQAYRYAHNLAQLYGVEGKVLIKTHKGNFLRDIERLMQR